MTDCRKGENQVNNVLLGKKEKGGDFAEIELVDKSERKGYSEKNYFIFGPVCLGTTWSNLSLPAVFCEIEAGLTSFE